MNQSPRVSARPRHNLAGVRIRRAPIPQAIYWGAGILCFPFLIGSNPLLGASAIASAMIIGIMTWRQGEVQLLMFVCGYQWLGCFAPIVSAELAGESLANFLGGMQFVRATWLSLCGVIVFSAGAGLGLQKLVPQGRKASVSQFKDLAGTNQFVLIVAWGGLLAADIVLVKLLRVPSLGTAGLAIAMLRFSAALILFGSVFVRNRGWHFLFVVVCVEIVIGFLGFFSGFKTIFFLLLLAAGPLLPFRRGLKLGFAASLFLLLSLGLTWQAIKTEYRSFLNEDTGQQIVLTTVQERLRYLRLAVTELDKYSYVNASANTLDRIGYVTYFGHCLSYVPEVVPHTKGRLWNEAGQVLVPRILYPNKMVYHDSNRTNEFSGFRVADESEGTSIGIGYIGESYIDFGIPWMFIPIGLFGLLFGGCYGLILRLTNPRICGSAIGVAMVFSSTLLLESSNAKMLGGVVSSFLVYIVLLAIQRKFAPRWGPLFTCDSSLKR